MTTIDISAHLADLYAHRSLLEAELAEIGQRIEIAERFMVTLESPLPTRPDPVPPASDPPSQSAGATRSTSSARGPKACDHHVVRALRANDLRPYQRFKADLQSLALRYAELHDGEIDMKGLVPLAIRVGLSKAEYYKNSWGGVYRALQRDSRFIQVVPPGEGRFRVVPVPQEPAEADAA